MAAQKRLGWVGWVLVGLLFLAIFLARGEYGLARAIAFVPIYWFLSVLWRKMKSQPKLPSDPSQNSHRFR